MKAAEKDSKEVTFEKAMERLENSVEKLDEGSLTLEEALAAFEEGVRWSKESHRFLEKAEERIEIILKKEDGGYESAPFEEDENE